MKNDTLLALRKYQRARGVKQTGKVDNTTQEVMLMDLLEA